MKATKNVRGTQKNVPYVEVNNANDTVYVRSNIKRVEEVEFSGWEYDEFEYKFQDYVETLTISNDTSSIALLLSMLMSEIDFLKFRIGQIEGRV